METMGQSKVKMTTTLAGGLNYFSLPTRRPSCRLRTTTRAWCVFNHKVEILVTADIKRIGLILKTIREILLLILCRQMTKKIKQKKLSSGCVKNSHIATRALTTSMKFKVKEVLLSLSAQLKDSRFRSV